MLPWWHCGKEPACQCRRRRFNPWFWKIPWRRKWQPSPIFLSGEFHGQRSLAGYSPWDQKESNTVEHTRITTPPPPHLYSQPNTYSEFLDSRVLIVFSLVCSNSSTDTNFRCESLSHSHFLGLNNKVRKLDQDFV